MKTKPGPVIAVKIGGRAAADTSAMRQLLADIRSLLPAYRFLLIHGGGADVTTVTEVYGLKPVFEDGVRKTSDQEMPIVDMVLAGKVNKHLVRACHTAGIPAAGFSGVDGATLIGKRIGDSRTGTVLYVDTDLISAVLHGGWMPVIAPVSMEENGEPLNINADEAAFAIASSIPAAMLVFLSDIPGVLKEGNVMPEIDPAGVLREIESGVISGGMIPKVRSSLDALKKGVQRIAIGQFERRGDLEGLINGTRGTRIAGRGAPGADRCLHEDPG